MSLHSDQPPLAGLSSLNTVVGTGIFTDISIWRAGRLIDNYDHAMKVNRREWSVIAEQMILASQVLDET